MLQDPQPGDHIVVRFILDEIDSVPHLEALLFLWRSAPQTATCGQIANELYIAPARAADVLDDLQRRNLLARKPGADPLYFYDTASEQRNRLMQAVDATYRRELIRISGIIHSKASRGVRAFADAFRFRKDRD